ncbi:MAG: hypothetical protein ABSF94_14860 [Steroidobacteraceae bacterium]|jgi:hypothetical protein
MDYLLFMHDDVLSGSDAIGDDAWDVYIGRLQRDGHFDGGSAIGGGLTINKLGTGAKRITRHLTGYLRVSAGSIEQAQALVIGNPVYEAGGTVEIRELPTE